MLRRALAHVRGNVVAYLALFVALSGTAVAATRLPAKSVGTNQLQNRAVTGSKVARKTLTGANIRLSSLGPVPNAARVGGASRSHLQSRITGACTGNSAISQIKMTGGVSCEPTGTVTGVSAGSGLAGGGTSGDLTMSVNPTVVQSRVTGTCAPGSSVTSVAQDGTVTCSAPSFLDAVALGSQTLMPGDLVEFPTVYAASDIGLGDTVYTARTPGMYEITTSLVPSAASGVSFAEITIKSGVQTYPVPGAAAGAPAILTRIYPLQPGDTVSVQSTSGVTLESGSSLQLIRIGPVTS